DYFPRCSIDDPNLNNCLLKAFNTVRPYVKKGVEEIGILPFEPLVLPTFNLSQENLAVNYTLTAWNFTIRGIDNYNVKEINYNPQTLTFSAKMKFDALPFYSMYEVSGRLLHIPLEGKGFVSTTFLGPINATIRIEGELVEVDGVEYYNTTNIKVTEIIKDMEITVEGLFEGDEELGRITNHLLNLFSAEIMQAVTPALEQLAEEMLMRFMKSFTGSIPIEGKGFLSAAFLEPINTTIRIQGELVEVDGVEYYNTTNIKVTESIKDMEITIEGLFEGDEKLGKLHTAEELEKSDYKAKDTNSETEGSDQDEDEAKYEN
ncbi:hypothetical protein ILUMI_19855, partial [Ignelater luminosus]